MSESGISIKKINTQLMCVKPIKNNIISNNFIVKLCNNLTKKINIKKVKRCIVKYCKVIFKPH